MFCTKQNWQLHTQELFANMDCTGNFQTVVANGAEMLTEFDHPCKGTCSGWHQGFEKGAFESKLELEKLLKELEAQKAVSSLLSDCEMAARKIFLEVTKERDELKELFMDMLAQGCGNYRASDGSQQYDSLCISTWEHAIKFAFDKGWIKESDVSRW